MVVPPFPTRDPSDPEGDALLPHTAAHTAVPRGPGGHVLKQDQLFTPPFQWTHEYLCWNK